MAEDGGAIIWNLDVDDAKFNAAMASADKKADETGKSIDKSFSTAATNIGKSLDNAKKGSEQFAAGLSAIGAAGLAFGVTSVLAYQDSENALAQLSAVLKSTGGAAGVTAKQATDLATGFQQVSKYSDEAVLGAENTLLTFTSIGKDVFPTATQAILDTSQALGQDLQSSTIQIGKALNDPIAGIAALHRVGVEFTQGQKDTIKTLVESGKTMDAQKVILAELNKEFGGSAAAAAKTFSGQIAIVKNNFNDLQELIGKAISERFQPLIKGFNDWMKAMGGPEGMIKKFNDDILPKLIDNLPIITGLIIGGLTPAMYGLASSFIAAWLPLIPFIAAGVALGLVFKVLNDRLDLLGKGLPFLIGILSGIGAVIATIVVPAFVTWAGVALTAAAASIAAAAPFILIGIAVAALVTGIILLIKNWDAVWSTIATTVGNALKGIGTFVSDTLKSLGTIIKDALTGITTFFVDTALAIVKFWMDLPTNIAFALGFALATIIKWGTDTFNYLVTNVPIWIQNVSDFFQQLPGKIALTLTDLLTRFNQWGVDTLTSLRNSITNLISNMVSWFQQLPGRVSAALSDLGNQVRNSFVNAFNSAQGEVNSWPGKIAQWGRNVGDAFVNGVKGGLNNLKDAFTNGFNNARGSIEGHSPPKEGPLKDIDKWGFNIGNAWVQGMQSAIGQFSLPQMGNGSIGSMGTAPSLGGMSAGSNTKGGQQVTVNIGKVENQSDIDSLIHELGFRAMLAPEIAL